jgi:hypothetical protein
LLQPGMAQYRVVVTFDNGKQYYSNTIALKSYSVSSKPQLQTNRISGSAMMVNSTARYQYMITDVSGRTMASGQISEGTNTVFTGHLAGGIYMIRFSNGSDSFVEKFTRQ